MLKPGENFGYRAIIANQTYNTNVAAFEASTVYMIKAEIFLSILRHNNAFCYRFLEEVASDLADSDARTVNLTQKHIRGRLAEALLLLRKNYGLEEDGATINIYLSRDDLASLSNMMRSDAKENLLTAIEIASAKENGQAIVPEVCIFFEDTLFRANRTTKKNAEHFSAFNSYNYPPLAKAGVHIKYYRSYIHYPKTDNGLRIRTQMDQNIAILKLFPGINEQTVKAILNIEGLKAVVLESFGAGNAPRKEWLYNALKDASERGIIMVGSQNYLITPAGNCLE